MLLIDAPGTLDAADSYLTARSIAAGQGFTSPIVWHWLAPPAGLPQPSNDYWPPLEAILAAGAMRLLGDSFRAAQLPNTICAAALPLVAYLQACRWNADRWAAWTAAILALAAGPYFARFATTDAAALFALAGSLALLLADQRPFRSGLLSGVAQLGRADGTLLLVAVPVLGWPAAGLGFVLVAGWWLLRNLLTFGVPFGAGTSAIWLTEYNDLFRPGGIGPSVWLASGAGAILATRIEAAGTNLLTLAELGLYLLWPFAIAGALRVRPAACLRYLAVLALFMTLIVPFPGQRGGFAHSLAALLPAFSALSAIGLGFVLGRLHRERYRWLPVAGYAVASVGVAFQLAAGWRSWSGEMAAVARALDGATVAIADPGSYAVASGGQAVSLPNRPAGEVAPFLRRYGVRYLVVGDAYPAAWRIDDPPDGWREVRTVGRFRVYRID